MNPESRRSVAGHLRTLNERLDAIEQLLDTGPLSTDEGRVEACRIIAPLLVEAREALEQMPLQGLPPRLLEDLLKRWPRVVNRMATFLAQGLLS